MARRYIPRIYGPKPLSIRLLRKGCANRPFYHIIAVVTDDPCESEGVEQLGIFDPLLNEHNERLLAVNLDRFKHYVAEGAWIKSTVAMLLGQAGVLPQHPHSLTMAWKARQRKIEMENQANNSNTNEAK
ncbi:probable 28S ribosomal protein S16, mitochondrial [Caerostris extrusa]|uniref:Small ribosomal subunit protein bS16m n=1 Tax=Caerostris extrusa TaxID=172846 RepID=A0AAV4MB02_CAEEX|nr:probable 28S ribosomal protein S16, mitochondrial [Caerostris extrusa]